MTDTNYEIIFFSNGHTAVFKDNEPQEELNYPWLLAMLNYLKTRGVELENAMITMPDGKQAVLALDESGKVNWITQ